MLVCNVTRGVTEKSKTNEVIRVKPIQIERVHRWILDSNGGLRSGLRKGTEVSKCKVEKKKKGTEVKDEM